MLKVQRADHTRNSVVAVRRILNMTKREVITLKDIVSNPSEELLSKKEYMQTDEFLKDSHNVKMFNLIDKLMYFRDKFLGKNVKENSDFVEEYNVIRKKDIGALSKKAKKELSIK